MAHNGETTCNRQDHLDATEPELPEPACRLAYFVSRFPKVTETFILYEMIELDGHGLRAEVFPLVREGGPVAHRDVARFDDRVHACRLFSGPVLGAQWFWMRRRPLVYLRLWAAILIGNAISPGFLLRALAVLPMAAWFARRLTELGVPHVHAHWATHPTLAAYVAHRLAGVTYSFTTHAHDLYIARPMLGRKVAAAEFVVTISDFNRRLIARLYGASAEAKTHVVRCGVDTQAFQPPAAARARRVPLLLCVGSLEAYKGHRFLLEACARLRARGVRLRCLCVGAGRLEARLRRRAGRLGLRGTVRFLGPVPQERLRGLVAAAAVVVQPSVVLRSGRMEGIPVALMEALAMERAAVATNISGIPELVEHEVTGLLVPERDPGALAAAVERLLRDPALAARLGRAGRARVLAQFDLRKNVAALAAALSPFVQNSCPLTQACGCRDRTA